jgi:DNA-binding transcriptional ArsR family regulator
MVNIQSERLDLIFYALSDATRRKILHMLQKKTRTVTELAEPFRMSLAAVSKHIKILERAELIQRTKSGRLHHCTFNPTKLKTAEACIQHYTQYWNQRLDALASEIE